MDRRSTRCNRSARRGRSSRRGAGFTYIGLLIALAALGISLAATGELWRTAAKREREQELLFAGREFRNALESYYATTPGGQARYPRNLEDLLDDRRDRAMRRHLRRVYADPMTGKADWVIVEAPGGGIAGVHSRSEAKPLKVDGFAAQEAKFKEAQSYAGWKFVFEVRGAQARLPAAR